MESELSNKLTNGFFVLISFRRRNIEQKNSFVNFLDSP